MKCKKTGCLHPPIDSEYYPIIGKQEKKKTSLKKITIELTVER